MGSNENEIAKKEHDAKYGAKRVTPYLGDGAGNLIRQTIQGFNIGPYDDIELAYTGANVTTITYKLSGSTTATLTLGYTGDNLTSVVKS